MTGKKYTLNWSPWHSSETKMLPSNHISFLWPILFPFLWDNYFLPSPSSLLSVNGIYSSKWQFLMISFSHPCSVSWLLPNLRKTELIRKAPQAPTIASTNLAASAPINSNLSPISMDEALASLLMPTFNLYKSPTPLADLKILLLEFCPLTSVSPSLLLDLVHHSTIFFLVLKIIPLLALLSSLELPYFFPSFYNKITQQLLKLSISNFFPQTAEFTC